MLSTRGDSSAAPEPLGPAAVLWNDFVGSAAADEAFSGGARGRGLYEAAGLDPERWVILGVDLVIHGGTEHARVYAFDKSTQQVAVHEDLLDLAFQEGELVVAAFEVDPDATATFRALFDNIAIRLIARGVSDQRLVVRSP